MVTNSGASSGGSDEGLVALPTAIAAALDVATRRAERVFVVGGVVRDLLMSREIGEHDLDIVVEGQGIPFAHSLANKLQCSVRAHEPFLTAKLLAPFGVSVVAGQPLLDEVDIATARQETYEKPGALPTVTPATIENDLWRRDFSANAIALPLDLYEQARVGQLSPAALSNLVIDPCGGYTDIKHATLRILHPRSFIDDPTRLFRAVRYIVRLSFHFDMETLAGFLEAVKSGALATLSPRRVWNEVMAAFDERSPCEVVQEFLQRGLFGGLPVVSVDDSAWVFEGLERLEVLRPGLGQDIFAEAGKVLVMANLLREGREDVAKAVHEGNRVLQRARNVLDAETNPGALRTIPDVAAAYCVYCTRDLQELLGACLNGVAK